MKNCVKKSLKTSNGITLIALVITIIVLLILAGISISMLSGDNSILQRATQAKKATDEATAKEQIQIEVLGSYDNTTTLNKDKLIENLRKIGATVTETDFPLTVSLEGYTFTIDSDGNVEKSGPKIVVDASSVTITNTDGSSITPGQVEQGTALKINFSASVESGTVTVSPILPHTTTAEEIVAKEVVFTITASVPGETVEPLTYKVSLKDVYKSNIVSMEELKTNANTYFGYDVINYAETLSSNLQDTEWQLFYAGKLDETDTTQEDRIYLISKGFVKNTVLPTKNGAYPIPTSSTNYQAAFCNDTTDGIIPQYTGSIDIAANLQKYNKKYFNFLNNNNSENPKLKAVAYMLDINTWSPFAISSKNYAEWAIGGPTVELLFTAYNQYNEAECEADVLENDGYYVRENKNKIFSEDTNQGAISGDMTLIDSPYSVSNLENQANGYWLASPAAFNDYYVMGVSRSGTVGKNLYSLNNFGFRPLVLLNSNFQLEKSTSGGKEVFQIVPKSE